MPYLFILISKGLGTLIKDRVNKELIYGWTWEGKTSSHSHSQFVDGSTLMDLARVSKVEDFRRTLDSYLVVLGKSINKDKFSIYLFNTSKPI